VTAPVGAIVGLHLDGMEPIMLDEIIETQSGRRYRVLDVRVQVRGKHVGRQHVRALVLGKPTFDELAREAAAGATYNGTQTLPPRVHHIRWYPRG
jgi:hypothetical protein